MQPGFVSELPWLESDAEPLLIVSRQGSPNRTVDLQPAGAANRTGSLTIPSNQKHGLTWIFVGSPGAKFKITLTPKDKVTITRSSNPIESSISTQRTFNSGSDLFEVAP